MTKARNIANIASDGSALADGTINYTDVSGTPTLATVATSGSFNDLSNQPAAFDPATLAAVAVSGSFNDLLNQPTPFNPATLATVAVSGSYTDLINNPTLGTAAATNATAYATAAQGTLADSATQPGDLATVATTGAYGDLSGTPAAALPLAGGAMTGAITTNSTFDGRNVSVDGAKLDTIATNANYITNTNQLTNGSSFAVTSDARFTDARQCNNTFNNPTTSRNNLGLGTGNGVTFGTVSATSYTGDGSALTGVGASTALNGVGSYILAQDSSMDNYLGNSGSQMYKAGRTVAGSSLVAMAAAGASRGGGSINTATSVSGTTGTIIPTGAGYSISNSGLLKDNNTFSGSWRMMSPGSNFMAGQSSSDWGLPYVALWVRYS